MLAAGLAVLVVTAVACPKIAGTSRPGNPPVGTFKLWDVLTIEFPTNWKLARTYPHNVGFPVYHVVRPDGTTPIQIEADVVDSLSDLDPRLTEASAKTRINGLVGRRAEDAGRTLIGLVLPNAKSSRAHPCITYYVLVSYRSDDPVAERIARTLTPRKPLPCITVVP